MAIPNDPYSTLDPRRRQPSPNGPGFSGSVPGTGYGTNPNLQRPQTPRSSGLNIPSGNTSYRPGIGPALTATGVGVGANIAGRQVTNALTGNAAGWANTAAGTATGIGAGMAANWAAGKLKPREEMPIYGGRHGDLTDLYGRRFEGAGPGIAGGAVQGMGYGSNPGLVAATGGLSLAAGALGGAIAGAATKNATSAFSDFSSKDAYQAIADGYQKYLGREGSDDEIMTHLRNQGYRPEDNQRWVGQTGLNYVLDTIADSPEAQAYAARAGGQPPAGPSATPELTAPAATPPDLTTPGVEPRASYGANVRMPAPGEFADSTGRDPFNGGGITGGMNLGAQLQAQAPSAPARQSNPAWFTGGWDQNKIDSGHRSPKYDVYRALRDGGFDPRLGITPEVEAILDNLGYGDGTVTGNDTYRFNSDDPAFNGITEFDLIRGFDTGNGQWNFEPVNAGGQVNGGLGQVGPQFGNVAGGPQALLGTGNGAYGADSYSDLVLQYLLQGLGLDRAAARLER